MSRSASDRGRQRAEAVGQLGAQLGDFVGAGSISASRL